VKIVRGGQIALSCANMRPLSTGSSGTDSLTRSAVAAASGCVVYRMRDSACRDAAYVNRCRPASCAA
jgi:hypothetical protein